MLGVAVAGAAVKIGKKLFGKKKKKRKAAPPPPCPQLCQIQQNQMMQNQMMGQILQNQQGILANQGTIIGQNAIQARATAAVLGNQAALNAMFSPCASPGAFLSSLNRMLGHFPLPC